jgi:peptidoglycan/LPS O-acetylase OafA/YrhL
MERVKYFSDAAARKNNFDFIRLIAAGSVVYSHSFPVVYGNNDDEPVYLLTTGQNTLGGIAVAVFFIISGFLVTQSFIRTKNVFTYMRSRALRIFPALAVMVLCCVFFIGPLMSAANTPAYFRSPFTFLYLLNAFTYTGYSTLPGVFLSNQFPATVNGSLWSLPYELLFYICIPAIGCICFRKYITGLLFASIAALMVFSAFLVTHHLPLMTNYFLCGCLFFLLKNKIMYHYALAIAAAVLMTACNHYHIFNPAFGLTGGYLVFYFVFHPRIKLNAVSKYGDYSYGIYLWSFPIQQMIVARTGLTSHNALFLACLLPVLLLAFLSWHFVEKHALSLKTYGHFK